MGRGYYVALVVGIAALAIGLPVAAQDDSGAAYSPSKLALEGPIDLLEAVRLTLDNDPNLLLAAEDAKSSFGLATELDGIFDLTFNGSLSYEYREQELTETQKMAEQDRRDGADDSVFLACTAETDLRSDLANLQDARGSVPAGLEGLTEVSSQDPTFTAQLRLLEAVIASTDDPTAQGLLLNERDLMIESQIFFLENEGVPGAAEACRETMANRERLGDIPETEEFKLGNIDLSFDKLFRNGVFVSPFITGDYSNTDFVGKRKGFFVADTFLGQQRRSPSGIPLERLVDFGGKNVQDTYTVEIGFDVNLPLLRGRGLATRAAADAADVDYEASELVLQHTATTSVLGTVLSYWNLVAVEQQIETLQRSVQLQNQVADVTRQLIDADEIPRAELPRAEAGVSNAQVQLNSAMGNLARAQVALLRAMGVSLGDSASLPNSTGAFPQAPGREDVERSATEELVRGAMGFRLDLQAAQKLIESGQLLADAAKINLHPRFDVSLGVSAIGRGEKSVSNAVDKFIAPSWNLGLAYQKPIGNHAAKGALTQREAERNQRQISASDLLRLIRLGVVESHANLLEAIDQLDYAERAVSSFEQTLNSELEKLRLGDSTLLDVILSEQQLTTSRLSVVSARQVVATLISQLRFEAGQLVTIEGESRTFSEQTLTTVPGLDS